MPAARPRTVPTYRPRLEALEDRTLLSVVPIGELTEGNASAWTTFASDNAAATVADDNTHVAAGNQSLRFDTQSGFDTGIRFSTGAVTWDVTSFQQLAFWTYSVNNTPIGFQGEQPVVALQSAGGSVRYTPHDQDMPDHGWRRHHIPLPGDDTWQREVTGTPDLQNITALEIHQDTWDSGFTVFYDGMQFSTRNVDDPPAAGPAPPAGVVPGLVAPKMLLYIFDPVMENHGGRRLHEVYGWDDPVQLTQRALGDFAESSHGLFLPQVVQTVIADAYPYFADGYQHTDESFDVAWANRDFHPGSSFDYARFIRENNLAARVDNGAIDEVWVYAPPIAGMYESVMAGQGAYWINGPTQQAGQRVFPIMGLNYERGVGEAIHSFGHRVENTIAHAYQTNSPGDNAAPAWTRFTRLDRDAPGQGGVGNVHFPVNGQSDYDYDNSLVVMSNADDWDNYPNFTGAVRAFNSSEWTPTHQDPQREYLDWWYDHMPHFLGRGPDDRLMNWWRYIGDLDPFKANGQTFHGADGTGKAWLTGASEGGMVLGVMPLRGAALIDGVVGRMDLYIDGVYSASDTLVPFTFDWNTAGLAPGRHTLQVRAYDVQNGTETLAPVVNVVAPGAARVTDLVPGAGSSNPANLTSAGGLLYFTVTVPGLGTELFRSDGTTAGTQLLADINPGAASSSPRNLTAVGNLLYFTALHPQTGWELYRSDGTPEGTYRISDINPGSGSSNPSNLTSPRSAGGTLYFTASQPQSGVELWKSDGTAGGTVLVRDLVPGPGSSSPTKLLAFNNQLVFVCTTPAFGQELWRSDGTAGGTVLIRDIRAGKDGAMIGTPVQAGGVLYFSAFTTATGAELWRSDGTAGGTALVRDINPGAASSSPAHLRAVGSRVYFVAGQPGTGRELWRSDGAAGNTQLVKDIFAGAGSSHPASLVAVGNVLYFTATHPTFGTELWRSDGSGTGTVLVADLVPGSGSSSPSSLVVSAGRLFFVAQTAAYGLELWRTSGGTGGTALVSDINPKAASSSPGGFIDLGGWLYFAAFDPVRGRELWVYRR